MAITDKVIFIDRDGTMGPNSNVEYPQDFLPFDYLKDTIDLLHKKGYKVFVFTNQSCIARGKDGGYDFESEFKSYGVDDYFICPHDDKDDCNCRKPKTGLLLSAQKKYNLNLADCIVIGDRWSDMLAGHNAGCRCILVKTGRGNAALMQDRYRWADCKPIFIGNNLQDVAEWLETAVK